MAQSKERHYDISNPIPMRDLPLKTWVVVERRLPGGRARLISKHPCQKAAEAERDRLNSGVGERPFAACILLEPVAQRMGGHQAPTTST
jgi:hypothetical protein